MDFSKVRNWIKKMNQIMDLYEGNEEFTATERDLLLDYNHRIAGEIRKINILSEPEEANSVSSLGHIKETNVHVEQFTQVSRTSPPEDAAPPKPAPAAETEEINSYPNLFDHLEVHDVYSKLALKPLKDIREGMGLNEKIVAQNELFNGDKQAFEEVIQQLNQSSDFQRARQYLCQSVIPRFNWTDDSKEKTVDAFIRLVKRRHL
jgi:hypothetical protein